MNVKDELHQLIDQLDEEGAREVLAYARSLAVPRVQPQAPAESVDDLELAQLPAQAVVQIQEPEA
jgi:hypothetical protein